MKKSINDVQLKTLISAARGEVRSDLVIKNAKILNVFTGELETGDVAVSGGFIAGIGEYEGKEEIDAEGGIIIFLPFAGCSQTVIRAASPTQTPRYNTESPRPHNT